MSDTATDVSESIARARVELMRLDVVLARAEFRSTTAVFDHLREGPQCGLCGPTIHPTDLRGEILTMLDTQTIGDLQRGGEAERDAEARRTAGILQGNLRILLEELDEILAAGNPMDYLAPLWLSPMADAERKLALAVEQAAKSAGLVTHEE